MGSLVGLVVMAVVNESGDGMEGIKGHISLLNLKII